MKAGYDRDVEDYCRGSCRCEGGCEGDEGGGEEGGGGGDSRDGGKSLIIEEAPVVGYGCGPD